MSSNPPIDSTTRITGRHLQALCDKYNAFEIQLVTGIFQGVISRLTSKANLDKPISDACVCFIIRTLLQRPEWAPLPKLNNHADLVDRIKELPESFPLPNLPTYSGVYIGKSSTTSHCLRKGSAEMFPISIWITILLRHWDDFVIEGKEHFLYKMMEDEAFSRWFNGMNSIVLSKGWSQKLPPENETGRQVPDRIKGKDIKLLHKGKDYNFGHLQLQYILGAFMAYTSTHTAQKNLNMPLNDVTRSLIIRYVKANPEWAILPETISFSDFQEKMSEVNGLFPIPCSSSKLGVLIGRSISTVNAMKSQKRSTDRVVIHNWATIIVDQLDDILKEGKDHIIYKAINDEAKSRGLTIHDILGHQGWPKEKPE